MAHGALKKVLGQIFRQTRHQAEATDGQLLQSFTSQGDEAAFEMLVQRHGPMVLQLCQRLLPDARAAADVFQATFLVLARKAGSLRKQGSIASWLYSTAYKMAARTRKAGSTTESRVQENQESWSEERRTAV